MYQTVELRYPNIVVPIYYPTAAIPDYRYSLFKKNYVVETWHHFKVLRKSYNFNNIYFNLIHSLESTSRQ